MLDCVLGSYSSWLLLEWNSSDQIDAYDAALRVPAGPNIWTDGSLVLDKVSGASSSGSGFRAHLSSWAWRGTLMTSVPLVERLSSVGPLVLCLGLSRLCRGRSFGRVGLALQSSEAIHVGVDNRSVVRQVGRLLDGVRSSRPAELVFFFGLVRFWNRGGVTLFV